MSSPDNFSEGTCPEQNKYEPTADELAKAQAAMNKAMGSDTLKDKCTKTSDFKTGKADVGLSGASVEGPSYSSTETGCGALALMSNSVAQTQNIISCSLNTQKNVSDIAIVQSNKINVIIGPGWNPNIKINQYNKATVEVNQSISGSQEKQMSDALNQMLDQMSKTVQDTKGGIFSTPAGASSASSFQSMITQKAQKNAVSTWINQFKSNLSQINEINITLTGYDPISVQQQIESQKAGQQVPIDINQENILEYRATMLINIALKDLFSTTAGQAIKQVLENEQKTTGASLLPDFSFGPGSISSIIFILLFGAACYYFYKNGTLDMLSVALKAFMVAIPVVSVGLMIYYLTQSNWVYGGIAGGVFILSGGVGVYYYFKGGMPVTTEIPAVENASSSAVATASVTAPPSVAASVLSFKKKPAPAPLSLADGFALLSKKFPQYIKGETYTKTWKDFLEKHVTSETDLSVETLGNEIANTPEYTELFQLIPLKRYVPELAQWLEMACPYKHPELLEELETLVETITDSPQKKDKLLKLLQNIDKDVKKDDKRLTNQGIADYLIQSQTLVNPKWAFNKIPLIDAKKNYPALMAYVHNRIKGRLNVESSENIPKSKEPDSSKPKADESKAESKTGGSTDESKPPESEPKTDEPTSEPKTDKP